MTIVIDASVVVAALVNKESEGIWAEQLLASDQLIAPHLLPAECANILRKLEMRGEVSPLDSARAHTEVQALRAGLLSFHPFAQRVWQLRRNVTAYDGWYVAIAEAYGLRLATLDQRLARAPGPQCRFVTPLT